MAISVAELAERLDGRVQGDGTRRVSGVAALEQAGASDLSFAVHRRYLRNVDPARPGAVLLAAAEASGYAGTAIVVANPHLAFACAAALLHPPPPVTAGIHPSAVVDPQAQVAAGAAVGALALVEAGARVGEGAYVGPGCRVGRNVQIGPGTRLVGDVSVLNDCVLGRDCIVWPGAVIGADGFGYARDGARWVKVPQLGRVVIGDAVEIGANTTIDRGALGDTVIGDGVKIDNLVQVAHNVRIGENTIIAGCAGIAGSAVIGRRCAIGGQVGIAGHLEIADDVQILGTSFVSGSIRESGAYSSSLKAEAVGKWRRNAARMHHLDEMAERLRQVEEQLRRLSKES